MSNAHSTSLGYGPADDLVLRDLSHAADAYRAVSVSVEKGHPEVALYEAQGFEQVGDTPHAVVLRRVLA